MKAARIVIEFVCIIAILVLAVGWLGAEKELKNYQSELTKANQLLASANLEIDELKNELTANSIALKKLAEDNRELSGVVFNLRTKKPKEFGSLEELKAWLAEDDSDSTFYFFEGVVDFTKPYDCDDYAVALMRNALEDYYLISTQINDEHMLNSTIIGNDIYLIEPSTDKVWLWGQRD